MIPDPPPRFAWLMFLATNLCLVWATGSVTAGLAGYFGLCSLWLIVRDEHKPRGDSEGCLGRRSVGSGPTVKGRHKRATSRETRIWNRKFLGKSLRGGSDQERVSRWQDELASNTDKEQGS